jgi:hypothetical protein
VLSTTRLAASRADGDDLVTAVSTTVTRHLPRSLIVASSFPAKGLRNRQAGLLWRCDNPATLSIHRR